MRGVWGQTTKSTDNQCKEWKKGHRYTSAKTIKWDYKLYANEFENWDDKLTIA